MDKHMLALHPMHNRRLLFFNLKPKKDDLHSTFLARIVDEAAIAEMEKLSIPGMILHLFCHSTPVSETSKPIRRMIVETLRTDPNLRK